jgi:hypothetical protein
MIIFECRLFCFVSPLYNYRIFTHTFRGAKVIIGLAPFCTLADNRLKVLQSSVGGQNAAAFRKIMHISQGVKARLERNPQIMVGVMRYIGERIIHTHLHQRADISSYYLRTMWS